MKRNKDANFIKKNAGFSLVEILVCIAILAIVSVPVLKSLRTSARLNQKAHFTQKLTNYAQEELELIKAMSFSDYESYRGVSPITNEASSALITGGSTQYETALHTVLDEDNNDISGGGGNKKLAMDRFGSEASAYEDELFSPFFYQLQNVEISSEKYTMQVTVEPAVYSMKNTGTDAYGTDINVSGMIDIKDVDSSVFPVISGEINMYDTGAGDDGASLLDNIAEKYALLAGTDKPDDKLPLLKALTKTADVDIAVTGSGDSAEIKVTTTVNYKCEYGGKEIELNYIVYTGTYPYTPAESGNAKKTNGVEGGGSVFIFAEAFEGKLPGIGEGALVSDSEHCKNIININLSTSDDMPVDIYFIRSNPKVIYDTTTGNPISSEAGYNFDTITINGNDYFSFPKDMENYPSGTVYKGDYEIDGGKLYSNVKVSKFDLSTRLMQEIAAEQSIGIGSYAARCYQVTVELFKEDADGNTSADEMEAKVTSAKLVKG